MSQQKGPHSNIYQVVSISAAIGSLISFIVVGGLYGLVGWIIALVLSAIAAFTAVAPVYMAKK
jgi:hypothetical protein